jgi:hypothetical protein
LMSSRSSSCLLGGFERPAAPMLALAETGGFSGCGGAGAPGGPFTSFDKAFGLV